MSQTDEAAPGLPAQLHRMARRQQMSCAERHVHIEGANALRSLPVYVSSDTPALLLVDTLLAATIGIVLHLLTTCLIQAAAAGSVYVLKCSRLEAPEEPCNHSLLFFCTETFCFLS